MLKYTQGEFETVKQQNHQKTKLCLIPGSTWETLMGKHMEDCY